MSEESGMQELTFEEIDAVSGAGWLSDLIEWVGDHIRAWINSTGNEDGVQEYDYGIKFTRSWG